MDLLLQGGGFELPANGVPGQADTTTVIDPSPSEFKGFYRIAVEAP